MFSENTIKLIKQREDLLSSRNKTKDTRNKISNLFEETKKSIKSDYSKHKRQVIKRNLEQYKTTKRPSKELNFNKTWIQKLTSSKEGTKSRKEIIAYATKFSKDLYSKKGNKNQREIIEYSTKYVHLVPMLSLCRRKKSMITYIYLKLKKPRLRQSNQRKFKNRCTSSPLTWYSTLKLCLNNGVNLLSYFSF